jgi:two-component system, NtrC family, sensor kinase
MRTRYAKSSVAVKLLLPLLTVFLGLWGAGTVGFAYFARKSLESNARLEVEETAEIVLRLLEQKQDVLQSQARWIADQPTVVAALGRGDRATLQRSLLPLQGSLKLDFITVVDPAGNTIENLQQGALNRVVLDDLNARRAAGIGFELSDVIHAQKTGPSSIAGVTAIKSQQKILGGVLVGTAVSAELLTDLSAKGDKQIVVLRGTQVVASTIPTAKLVDWDPIIANPTAQAITLEQQEYLAQTITLAGDSNAALQLVVLKSTSFLRQAEQKLWSLVGGFGLLGTGIVASVAMVSNRMTRRLAQQLRDLTMATQQIANRSFREQLPVQSQDEIGQLSRSFNQMADQLRQQDEQIHQQMQLLEDTLNQLQQTQAQLIQTEKMSSLGQLVAGIAHEVNNPLSFIYGNLGCTKQYFQDIFTLLNLYQAYYPNPAPAIHDQIHQIDLAFIQTDWLHLIHSMQVGTRRVQDIVLSLRTFSRLDEAALKRIDLHQSIDSTLLMLQHRLTHGVGHGEILVQKDYAELPDIECYAGQLNQVILNLVNNAIEALDSVETPRIQIKTEPADPNRVRITITDNGVGIAPEIQAKVFDPFFTTKPVGKGTGLGLAVSYQVIVNQHQGNLYCQSTPGLGTIFVIEIPIKA